MIGLENVRLFISKWKEIKRLKQEMNDLQMKVVLDLGGQPMRHLVDGRYLLAVTKKTIKGGAVVHCVHVEEIETVNAGIPPQK